ncbi:MAG: FlgD immunoglobulin-like domain containing protein [Kiritimatiellia bacterium]|jgi:hypothetical protein
MKRLLVVVLALPLLAAAATAVAESPPVHIRYELPRDGSVTLVIDNARGERVRNLVGGAWRQAGAQEDVWDGRDDRGNPAPAGDYRWRGLHHGGITSHFIGAFNSPGSPPWNVHQKPAGWYLRPSGSGGWLSDHERPFCLHAAGTNVFIGSPIAEAGHSIIQVGSDGRKRWGTLWLSLSGANAIAVDEDEGVLFVAGERGWMKDWLAVNRLDLKTYGWLGNPPDVRARRTDACFVKESINDFADIRGMALTGEHIVLSLADRGRLAFFDRETALHARDVPLPGAGAIVKLPDGRFVGLSGNTVVRLDLDRGNHVPWVAEGLKQASGLAIDRAGRIYVGDLAPDEQCVKVFAPDGRPLRRIGARGGRREGRFNPLAMGAPVAVAIDAADQLWVAEHEHLPKRVSVWTLGGGLVRDFIGPPGYGGGGALLADPLATTPQSANPGAPDALTAFYRGMRFSVPPWPGAATLDAVMFRPEAHADLPCRIDENAVPHHPVRHGDSLYFVHDNGWDVPAVFIAEADGDRLVPRVVFGKIDTLRKAWQSRHPAYVESLGKTGVFLWQDANGDGRAEPGEVAVEPGWKTGALWGLRTWPTLNLLAREQDALVVLLPLPGEPLRYSLDAATRIPLPDVAVRQGVVAIAPDRQGNYILNCGGGGSQGSVENVLLSLAPDGRVRWTHPNPFPANWHNSPMPRAGDIQHTLNVEGFASAGDAIGDVFQLNGNKGTRYLFTHDGLFVAELFGDMRRNPMQQNLHQAEHGMRLDQNSLGDECFFGWLGEAPDGRTLQIVGKDALNVCDVRGLDSLVRLDGAPIRLATSAPPIAALPPAERGPLPTVRAGGFGLTPGWEKIAPRSFPDDEPVASFAIGHTAHALTLWIRVEDATPFENAGGDLDTLFHTGDAIDLRWASDPGLPSDRVRPGPGDRRLVVAPCEAGAVVVRHVYVDPESTTPPVAFSSPVGTEHVAHVTRIGDAKTTIARDADGYTLTVTIPWKALGEPVRVEGLRRGDVGVIFGDASGSRVIRRCYCFDPGSQEVSDIPSEVRINPSQWGEFRF